MMEVVQRNVLARVCQLASRQTRVCRTTERRIADFIGADVVYVRHALECLTHLGIVRIETVDNNVKHSDALLRITVFPDPPIITRTLCKRCDNCIETGGCRCPQETAQ